MDEIYGIALFPCDPDAIEAFLEVSEDADAVIFHHGVRKPDETKPNAAWTPAVFRPETGLGQFDVHEECMGHYEAAERNRYADGFGIPENLEHALWMSLYGKKEDVLGFCRRFSDLFGIECRIGYAFGSIFAEWKPFTGFEHMTPAGGAHADLMSMVYDVPPSWD